MEFDENFEEAHIPDVTIESTTNVTSPRRRRQGTLWILQILSYILKFSLFISIYLQQFILRNCYYFVVLSFIIHCLVLHFVKVSSFKEP
jgi:hypothetical protein